MFDLAGDPAELRNVAGDPAQAARLAELKAELARLKREFKDDDQFGAEIPPNGVDGGAKNRKAFGVKTVAEAIAGSGSMSR